MSDTLMIIVAGSRGCGKTTIANLIKKAFIEHGLEAAVVTPIDEELMTKSIISIRDRNPERVLIIEEMQLNMEAMSLDTNLAHHRESMILESGMDYLMPDPIVLEATIDIPEKKRDQTFRNRGKHFKK
jgi:thymidylate kinase